MPNNQTESEQIMWGSHLAPLAACLAVTSGPVLEIGIGHFSTPVLHAFLGAAGRDFISVEKNEEWKNEIYNLLGVDSPKNRILHFPEKIDGAINIAKRVVLSIVFIDDSPGGTNRSTHFLNFINRSEFVVVHDYHRENEEAIRPLLEGCNYIVCDKYKPPTLVASKTRRIPPVLNDLSYMRLTSTPISGEKEGHAN